MAQVLAGASSLYYELYDTDPSPSRMTLVLLHGVGGNHASWFHQVAAWREHYRLLVIDARGFGNSTDAENVGRDRFVDDLSAVLDAARVDRAVLIGQSMGGGTAVSYACRNPHRVAGLVLADTLFGISLPDGVRERMAALTTRNASLSQIERVLGSTCVRTRPEAAVLYTSLASFNRYNVRTLVGRQEEQAPQTLAATGVPTLFVVGEEDVLFPPQEVEVVSRAVGGADYARLPSAGHSAYFETPAAFNETVIGWLERRGIRV